MNPYEAPLCLTCGRRLRKYTCSISGFADEPPPTRITRNGEPCEIVSKRKRAWQTDGRDVMIYGLWAGRWGDYGDDLFCGLNCAARWARQHAKRR